MKIDKKVTGAGKENKMLKYLHSNVFYDHANMWMVFVLRLETASLEQAAI